MSLSSDIREGVIRTLILKGVRNPLETIGLSPHILELGLSDDELFVFCKDMAKDLVVHFHPDRQSSAYRHVVELQRKFGEAFNMLKDRKTFDFALEKFKGEHSGFRSNENSVSQSLEVKTAALAKVEEELRSASEKFELMKRSQTVSSERLFNFIALRGMRFSKRVIRHSGAMTIQQTSRINLLELESYTSCLMKDKLRSRLGVPTRELIDKALASDEMFPSVHYSATGIRDQTSPMWNDSITKSGLKKLAGRYREALQQFGNMLAERSDGVTELSIRFNSVHIEERGVIKVGTRRYPIIGSVSLDDINPRYYWTNDDSDLVHEIVMDKLVPVLFEPLWEIGPFSALVCMKEEVAKNGVIGKQLRTDWMRAEMRSHKAYRVRSIILETITDESD